MTATDRMSSLREEYARLGEDVSDMTDQELLLRELDRTRAESRRHENAHSALLQDRAEYARSVYAAARRAAQEDRIAQGGIYLTALLQQSMRPISELIHRVEQLPERPGAKQVGEIKGAAQRSRWVLNGATGRDAESARSDDGVRLVEKQRDEIARLRDLIGERGRRLHAAHGPVYVGRRCECSGCELIRAMDDVPVEAGAA